MNKRLTRTQIIRYGKLWKYGLASGKFFHNLTELAEYVGQPRSVIWRLSRARGWPALRETKKEREVKGIDMAEVKGIDMAKVTAAWERLCCKTSLKRDTLKYFRQQDMAWKSVGRRHKKAAD